MSNSSIDNKLNEIMIETGKIHKMNQMKKKICLDLKRED